MRINRKKRGGHICVFGDLHVGDVFEFGDRLFMKLEKDLNGRSPIIVLATGVITTMLPSEWVRKDYGEYVPAFDCEGKQQ